MAADINSVVLVGRLTRDIEVRYTPSGVPIGKIGLANTRRTKKGDQWVDETNFFDVTLFGKSAESLSAYLLKGQQICVQGELRFEQWEKDGQKASRVSVVADNIQLLGSKNNNNQGNAPMNNQGYSNGGQSSKPAGAYTPNGQPASMPTSSHTFDEDIPF